MHTVSRKSERLVNLTIALLATRRYLTKSEIFRTIEGYQGSTESKERMFERDKDDLRNLGIKIEVGNIDPLFEDEAGYRIPYDSYTLNIGNLTPRQLALASLATEAWRGAALDVFAQSALIKLSATGIEPDLEALPAIEPRMSASGNELVLISQAITTRTAVNFSYFSIDLRKEKRTVLPFGLASQNGHWYLVGKDTTRNDIRTFRLDRMSDDFTLSGKKGCYEIPADFNLESALAPSNAAREVLLRVRKGKGHLLRIISAEPSDDGDWDLLHITSNNEERLTDLILWHGSDVEVIQPIDFRTRIIASLEKLVDIHG